MNKGLEALNEIKISLCEYGHTLPVDKYNVSIVEKELKKPKMFYEILKEFVDETEIYIEHPNEDEFARPIDTQELKIKLEAYKHILSMFEGNFPEVLEDE